MKIPKITAKSFKSDDKLLWFNSKDKWRVTCTNAASADIFVSWDEIGEVITDLKVDDASDAGNKIIRDLTGGTCRSYVHSGSYEKRIAPHRFLEIQISPGESSEWVMEKPRQASKHRFSIRYVSIWDSWTLQHTIPKPDQRVQPKAG
jgi:hypothetical protein